MKLATLFLALSVLPDIQVFYTYIDVCIGIPDDTPGCIFCRLQHRALYSSNPGFQECFSLPVAFWVVNRDIHLLSAITLIFIQLRIFDKM